MAIFRVTEGTAVTARVKFSRNGAAIIPATLRYRVDCETTGDPVVEWTPSAPAAAVNVLIPAPSNRLRDQANAVERKRFTVEANYGTDSAFVTRGWYELENTRGI